MPGGDGYYDDDKWLMVAPRSSVVEHLNQAAYLSNVWFLRDKLPADLPAC